MSSTAMLMDEEIKVTPVTNAVTWFEIPTYKLERARTFCTSSLHRAAAWLELWYSGGSCCRWTEVRWSI
jgi:hypothetical protein